MNDEDSRGNTSDRAESSTNIPAEKLVALSNASDEMMKTIFRRDPQATLRTIVRHVHDILEGEACAIFLVPEDSPGELILEASYTDKLEYSHHHSEPLKIQSVLHGGLTGHIAHKGEIVSLHGKPLTNNPYVSGRRPYDYLSSRKCYSLLAIPLKDRKGRLLGMLKVDNKKRQTGDKGSNEEVFFTTGDTSIAIVLANKITIVLENLRTSETLRGLMHAMHTAQDLNEILNIILQKGLMLLHADRGEFVLWNESKRDLAVVAIHGERTLEVGRAAPNPSIIRDVWNSQSPYLIRDVSNQPNYYEMDPLVQSEMATPLELEGRAIGVLNVEAFQLDSFDEQDLELAQLLSQYTTVAIQGVGKEKSFRNIVQQLAQHSPPRDEILASILESVRDIYGFDAGIIYIADYTERILRCSAYIGCEDLDVDPKEILIYRFEDHSIPTKMLRENKGWFTESPLKDPDFDPAWVNIFSTL